MMPSFLPEKLRSIPNQLTLIRLLAIPALLVLYPWNLHFLNIFCALVFFGAALTDLVDGYLARKWDQETPFGAVFDHVADKLLTVSALVLLAGSGAIYSWLAALLIGRDIAVNGIRLAALEQHRRIPASGFGKLKTFVLSAAITCLFINSTVFDIDFRKIGNILMFVALPISYGSAWLYAKEFWQLLTDRDKS